MRKMTFNRSWCWICAICAVMAVGCNHKAPPQPSGTVSTVDNGDKCHTGDKIITCVTGVCDPATGDCVGCLVDSDCKESDKPVCSDKKCIACDAAHACNHGKCDVTIGKCVECLADADCMLRERGVCWNGMCTACNEANCTQACNAVTGKCEAPVALPCPGGDCGVPSPIVIGTIDPGTIAIGNHEKNSHSVVSNSLQPHGL